jgi:hypothetical protein
VSTSIFSLLLSASSSPTDALLLPLPLLLQLLLVLLAEEVVLEVEQGDFVLLLLLLLPFVVPPAPDFVGVVGKDLLLLAPVNCLFRSRLFDLRLDKDVVSCCCT